MQSTIPPVLFDSYFSPLCIYFSLNLCAPLPSPNVDCYVITVVGLSVCQSVCLWATIRRNALKDFDENFMIDWRWYNTRKTSKRCGCCGSLSWLKKEIIDYYGGCVEDHHQDTFFWRGVGGGGWGGTRPFHAPETKRGRGLIMCIIFPAK